MLVNSLKAEAYSCLALYGFDHNLAKVKGYKDGWEMMLDRHEDAGLFHRGLVEFLSRKQIVVLYDAIVKEYFGYPDYLAYVAVVGKMDKNGVPPYNPKEQQQ